MRQDVSAQRAAGRSVVLVCVVAVGAVLELSSGDRGEVGRWLPDLAVGVVLSAAALGTGPRAPGLRLLLAAAAVSWYLGTFIAGALFLHVGVLVHLLVAYPGRRPRTRVGGVFVGAGYAVALAMPTWRDDLGLAALALGTTAVLAGQHLVGDRAARRYTAVAWTAGSVLALAMLGGIAVRALLPAWSSLPVLLLHDAAVALVAVLAVAGVRRPAVDRVTDLVVDLDESRSGTIRDALAGALGDPFLQVGHLFPDGSYRDASGAAVDWPPTPAGRTATLIDRDGRAFALLVHGDDLLVEPDVLAAVAAATRLTGSHATLRAEVDGRLAAVQASHRRLVEAADDERRRLARRVRDGAERRLLELDEVLRRAGTVSPGAAVRVTAARRELAVTIEDLRVLAAGLRPRELDTGLRAALGGLADRSPVPVQLVAPADRHDPVVEATVWFAAAEALANAVKHAGATAVRIEVTRRGGTLVLTVTDDGCGGAEPDRGAGLRGLADRVSALGGRLTVDSPATAGTRLTVELPLDRRPT